MVEWNNTPARVTFLRKADDGFVVIVTILVSGQRFLIFAINSKGSTSSIPRSRMTNCMVCRSSFVITSFAFCSPYLIYWVVFPQLMSFFDELIHKVSCVAGFFSVFQRLALF